jgi:hypothetical protein
VNIMRKSLLSGLGGIMVALSVATIAAPATAAAPSAADIPSGEAVSASSALPPDIQAQADEFAQYEAVLLESLGGSEDARTFDLDMALSRGVPVDLANDFAEGISFGGGSVSGDFTPSHPELDASSMRVLAACIGETRGWIDGFGAHARLNSCDTATLINVLASGATYATVAAVIADLGGGAYAAAAGAIAGAVFQLDANSISNCAADGTGVEIAAAGFICWAQ